MSTDAADLDRVQHWMQSVITHPDGIAAGIDSAEAREHIDVTAADVEQVIRRSQALSSIERLAVYGNAYYARLIECMAAEFPATQHAVGEEAFSGFVFGYLQLCPSTSYTLSDLGARFPEYLSTSRPARDSDDPDWADFLVDLATLERTYSDVFDGPGEETIELLSADELKAIPQEEWGDLRLVTAPSLRLLTFRFPAHEYATAVRSQAEVSIPEPQQTHLAVSRREYIVRRCALEPLPFDILTRLQRGDTLGNAITGAVEALGETDDLPQRLEEWFRTWTAAGYFVGVDAPAD